MAQAVASAVFTAKGRSRVKPEVVAEVLLDAMADVVLWFKPR